MASLLDCPPADELESVSSRARNPSPMQQSMLRSTFESSRSESTYIQQLNWRIKSPLSPKKLEQAISKTLDRHPIFKQKWLRTDVGLIAQKQPSAQWAFEGRHLESTAKNDKELERQLAKIVESDFERRFERLSDPLCRFTLVSIAKDDHLLIWTSHHALFDGRSRLILIEEILQNYRSLQRSQELLLPAAPHYHDYLDWLDAQTFHTSKAFWKRRLSTLSQPTPVPFAKMPAERASRIRHGKIQKSLPAALSIAIDTFSIKHRISPNIILQAAAGLVFSKLNNLEHVVFGAPRACRHSSIPQAADTVGLFVNTLPVVVSPLQSQTAGELLKETKRQWKRLRKHEHTPHATIQQASPLPQGQPLFNILVAYESYQLSEYIAKTDSPFSLSSATLKGFTDLPLSIQLAHGKRYSLEAVYRKDALSHRNAERLTQYLLKAITALIEDPDRKLADLCLLSDKDHAAFQRSAILPADSRPRSVIELFESTVATYPENTALVSSNESFTYLQLDAFSNRLARYLRKKGVQPGDHIGLFFGRDHWAPLAALTCLKLGAAYVPFDIDYPKDRLEWMLKDANISIALSTSDIDCPIDPKSALVLNLDTELNRIKRFSEKRLENTPHPEDTAYLMYTSGSTGRPKGVSIPQRGIARLVFKPNYVKLGPRTRILQLAPVSFDAATFEIWGALLNGGACIVYPNRVPTIEGLRESLRIHKINTMWLTASLFNFVVSSEPSILKGLRQILAGGEALSPAHVRKAQRALPKTTVINGYGPTENTTFSCCYPIPAPHSATALVPIGRPISGSTACVLDQNLKPMPIGVPGELCVGGLGIGHGYHQRKALTDAAFVENPFDSGLLYRTDDLAILKSDGSFDFIGRADDQVKIRGHRIEPAELATQIARLSEVSQCEVAAKEIANGDKMLVAFVVSERHKTVDTVDLTSKLARFLPSYMLPSVIAAVDEIPITQNGKADRNFLLSQIDQSQAPAPSLAAADLSAAERKLVAIWTRILGAVPRSTDSSFFQEGGNSLLATRLIYEIEKAFKRSLKYCELEANGSISSLARWIEKDETKQDTQISHSKFPVKRLPSGKSYKLPDTFRGALNHQLDSDRPTSAVIARAYRFEGNLDPAAFRSAFAALVTAQPMLRVRFVKEKSDTKAVVLEEPSINLSYINAEDQPAAAAEKQAIKDFDELSAAFFDVYSNHLYKARLVKIRPDLHIFTLATHHAISDGRSIEIVAESLSLAYNAIRQSETPSIPALRYNYFDYYASYKRWMQTKAFEPYRDYWEEQLKDIPKVELPIEQTFDASKTTPASMLNVRLAPGLASKVKEHCAKSGISLYAFMVTIQKTLLSRYTGKTDIPIGFAPDARLTEDTDMMMGDFGNLLYFRDRIEPTSTVATVQKTVAKSIYTAIDNKAYRYGDIRRTRPPAKYFTDDPLLQYMLIKADSSNAYALEGIKASAISRKKFPMAFKQQIFLREVADDITLSFVQPKVIFSKNALHRLIFNFQDFIKTAIRTPETQVCKLPNLQDPAKGRKPLSRQERKQCDLIPI